MMFSLLAGIVYAAAIYEKHGAAVTTKASDSISKRGMTFLVKNDSYEVFQNTSYEAIYLLGMNQTYTPCGESTPTHWWLYYEANDSLIGAGLWGGSLFVSMNYTLYSGLKYFAEVSSNGSKFDRCYSSAPSYPVNGTYINWTGASSVESENQDYAEEPIALLVEPVLLLYYYPEFPSPTPDNGIVNNTQVIINVTCASGNITLWFNNSIVINNTASPSSYTTSVTDDAPYTYIGLCSGTGINGSARTWIFDNSSPNIIVNPSTFFSTDNSSEISLLQSNNRINLTLTDNRDLFAFEINITSNTSVAYYESNETLSGTTVDILRNVNISAFGLGVHYADLYVADSHTDNDEFKEKDYITKTENKQVAFDTWQGNKVEIISVVEVEDWGIETQKDRKTMAVKFKKDILGKVPKKKTFVVTCDKKLIYREQSEYTAHFLCVDWGAKAGNWIDFENEEGDKPKKITEKKELFGFGQKYYEVEFENDYEVMHFNSIGGLNIEHVTYRFNVINIYPFNPSIYLQGDRIWTYTGEFNSTQNVSVNVTVLNNILDSECNCSGCVKTTDNCLIPFVYGCDSNNTMTVTYTGNYNYSSNKLGYNFSQQYITYQEFANGSTNILLSNGSIFNLTIYNYEIYNIRFKLNSLSNTVSNLIVDLFGDGVPDAIYPQTFNGTYTYADRFTNNLTTENISFLTPGTVIRHINYSTNNLYSPFIDNITLKISGFGVDPLSFYHYDSLVNLTNISRIANATDGIMWDDFSKGEISGHWSDDGGGHTVLQNQYVYDTQSATAGAGGGTCCNDHHYYNPGKFYSDSLDLTDYNKVTMRIHLSTSHQEYGVGCACTAICTSSASTGIKDVTNEVYHSFGTASGSSKYDKVVTIIKDGNYLKWYADGVYVNQLAITSGHQYGIYVDMSPDTNVAGNIYVTLSCGVTGYIYPVNYTGITGLYDGNLKWNTTKLAIVDTAILFNASSNITRAKVATTNLNPSGGTESLYLSNNNGTTWEYAADDAYHIFTSQGNLLRARFNLSITDEDEPLIITDYTVRVGTGTISNVGVDICNDGIKEYNMTGVVNESNSPLNISLSSISITSCINDNYDDLTYAVPIAFSSDNAGDMQISNIHAVQHLNYTFLSEYDVDNNEFDFSNITEYLNGTTKNVSILVTYDDNGTVSAYDVLNSYYGEKDVKITAHIGNNSVIRYVYWKYSPFNLSFIDDVEYFEMFPTKRNMTNIEPYGQSSTHGIWSMFSEAKHSEGVDVLVNLNNSIDTCVQSIRFSSYNYSISSNSTNVSITTNASSITYNMSTQTAQIFAYADIDCTNTSKKFILPNFCFFSLCTSCVRTTDWIDTCEFD